MHGAMVGGSLRARGVEVTYRYQVCKSGLDLFGTVRLGEYQSKKAMRHHSHW